MYEKWVKRLLDITLCSFALIVMSPLFLITAIAIKLSSRGPVFYYSDRMGKDRKPFHFYKFRSMHLLKGEDKKLFIADGDRLFLVGKIIRKLKIDELPQLINVLQGHMSIVGPRPMPVSSVDETYYGKYQEILSIRPGLTSAASLFDYTVGDTYTDDDAYRRDVLPYKLEMELYYIRNRSFRYDVSLIGRTMKLIIQKFLGVKKFPKQPEYDEVSNHEFEKEKTLF